MIGAGVSVATKGVHVGAVVGVSVAGIGVKVAVGVFVSVGRMTATVGVSSRHIVPHPPGQPSSLPQTRLS